MVRLSQCLRCFALLLLAGAVSICGCGDDGLPEESDPNAASEALKVALEAWKNGEDLEALKDLDPPVYFDDMSKNRGAKLESYELVPKTERNGLSVVCTATLKLRDEDGKASQKKVNYLIDTQEAIVIVPGDP